MVISAGIVVKAKPMKKAHWNEIVFLGNSCVLQCLQVVLLFLFILKSSFMETFSLHLSQEKFFLFGTDIIDFMLQNW